MRAKWAAFFSGHSWRHSVALKPFFGYWVAAFSIIWTFIEFTGYFFSIRGEPVKPNVWAALGAGIACAVWMSRPRLTRTVRLSDPDMLLQIAVDDMFRLKNGSFVIPSNRCFKHDHIDGDAVIVQFRNRFFSSAAHFDRALAEALRHVPSERAFVHGRPVDRYPIGTVAQLPLPGPGSRYAYIVASVELNEHGRGTPQLEDLKSALPALWDHIAERGNTRPLIVPVLGSGRQRLVQGRLELIALIVQSFLAGNRDRKPASRLTIVLSPKAYMDHRYNLDEIETYLSCAGKFHHLLNLTE